MIYARPLKFRKVVDALLDYSGGRLYLGPAGVGKSTAALSDIEYAVRESRLSHVPPIRRIPACYAACMRTWASAQTLRTLATYGFTTLEDIEGILGEFYEAAGIDTSVVLDAVVAMLTTTSDLEGYVRLAQYLQTSEAKIVESSDETKTVQSVLHDAIEWNLVRKSEHGYPVPALRIATHVFYIEKDGFITLSDIVGRGWSFSVPSYTGKGRDGQPFLDLDEDLKGRFHTLRSEVSEKINLAGVYNDPAADVSNGLLASLHDGSTIFAIKSSLSNQVAVLNFDNSLRLDSTYELDFKGLEAAVEMEDKLDQVDLDLFHERIDGEIKALELEFAGDEISEYLPDRHDVVKKLAECISGMKALALHQFLGDTNLYSEVFNRNRNCMSATRPLIDFIKPLVNEDDGALLVRTEEINTDLYNSVAYNDDLFKSGVSLELRVQGEVLEVSSSASLADVTYGGMCIWNYIHVSTLDTSIVEQMHVMTTTRKGGLHSALQLLAQHFSDRARDMSVYMVIETRDDTTIGMDNEEGTAIVRGLLGGITRFAYHIQEEEGVAGRSIWLRMKPYGEFAMPSNTIQFEGVRMEHYPVPHVEYDVDYLVDIEG